MASIFKRTQFFDQTGGLIRFLPWTMVTTSLGNMYDQRALVQWRLEGQYDPTDECALVSTLESARIDQEWTYLNSEATHGGLAMPENYSL